MSALIQDSPFAFHRGRQRRAKAQLPLELARPHYQQIPRCSQIPARPITRAASQQFRPRIVRHHHEQIVVAVRPRIASRHRAEQVDSLGPISLGQPPHHLVQRRIVGSENRGLDQPGPGMTPALAEGILALDFPKAMPPESTNSTCAPTKANSPATNRPNWKPTSTSAICWPVGNRKPARPSSRG